MTSLIGLNSLISAIHQEQSVLIVIYVQSRDGNLIIEVPVKLQNTYGKSANNNQNKDIIIF